MKKVIFILLAVTAVFAGGCAKKKPRLSVEEEYRIRQEKRMKRAREKREHRISSLSGLNSVELEEIERSKRENDLNPNPGSFVYSPKSQNVHSTGKSLDNINDEGQKKIKEYQKSVKQKQKSGRNWVYGL